MKELNDLEIGVGKLKKNSEQQKRIIEGLEKEKEALLQRSEMLSAKIAEMQKSYHEASQKIMDFVKSQVEPLKERMAGVAVELKSMNDTDKSLTKEAALQARRQEKHDSVLVKLLSDVNLVQKDLQNIEILKAGLKDQSQSLDATRREMLKELERSIDLIRKDFETKRVEDMRAQMSEFRKELERISGMEEEFRAYRKTQDTSFVKVTQKIADLEALLSEIRMLRKRADGSDEFSKGLELRLDKAIQSHKDSILEIRAQLSTDLQRASDSLKKEFETKRFEDAKAQMNEFRSEVKRLSNVEEEMRGYKASHDAELLRISKSIETAPTDITYLKRKLSEMDSLLVELSKVSLPKEEFSKNLSILLRRAEEADGRLTSLDRRLTAEKAALEKQIVEVSSDEKIMKRTQEGIRTAVSERFSDIDKRITDGLKGIAEQSARNSNIIEKIKEKISDIDQISENTVAISDMKERLTRMELASKQIADNQLMIDKIREKVRQVDALTSGIPKRSEAIEASLLKIGEAKELLVERTATLTEGLKGLEETLSEERQRIAAIEREFGVTDKRKESRLDRIDRELTDVRGTLSELNVIRTRLGSMETFSKGLDDRLGKGMEKIRSELSTKMDTGLESLLSRTEGEIKSLSKGLYDSSNEIKAIKENLAANSKLSKQASDTAELLSAVKDRVASLEFSVNSISKTVAIVEKIKDRIAGIEMLPAHEKDIKALKEKLSALDSSAKLIPKHDSDLRDLAKRVASLEPLLEEDEHQTAELEDMAKSIFKLDSAMKSAQKTLELMDPVRERLGRIENRIVGISDNSQSIDEIEVRLKDAEVLLAQIPKTVESVQRIKDTISDMKLIPKAVKDIESLRDRTGLAEARLKDTETALLQLPKALDSIQKLKEATSDNIQKLKDATTDTKLIPKAMKDIESIRDRVLSLESGTKIYPVFSEKIKSLEQRLSEEVERIEDMEKQTIIFDKTLPSAVRDLQSLKDKAGLMEARLKDAESSLLQLPKAAETIQKLKEATSDNIQKLKDATADIRLIPSTVKELKELREKSISFENRLDETETLLQQLPKTAETIQKLKDFTSDIKLLPKAISDIESLKQSTSDVKLMPAVVKDLQSMKEKAVSMDGRLSDAETMLQQLPKTAETIQKLKDFTSDIKVLPKALSDIESLKQTTSDIKLIPKVIGDIESLKQSTSDVKLIPKTINDVEALRQRMMTLEAGTRIYETFSEKISSMEESLEDERERIIAIEKEFGGTDKKKESRLDRIFQDISSIRQQLDDHGKYAQSLSDGQKSLASSLRAEMNETFKQVSRDLAQTRKEQDGLRMTDIRAGFEKASKFEKEFAVFREGNEKRLEGLSEELVSIEDEIKAQALLSSNLAKSLSKAETMTADMQALKEKLSYLSRMEEALKTSSVSETEFIQTVKSVNKRIDDIETMAKDSTEKLDAQLDESRDIINRAITDLSLEKTSSLDAKKTLEKRIASLEEGLSMKLSGMISRAEARTSKLEVEFAAAGKQQDLKIKEMLEGQKKLVLAEVSKDMSRMTKEFEVAEEKRKRDFEAMVKDARELDLKTKEKIREFGKELATIPGIEEALKAKIERISADHMRVIKESHAKLESRLQESDKGIRQLNNMITEMRTKLTDTRDYEKLIESRVTEVREDMESRVKTNEDIMDSQMDAFKKRLDHLMAQMVFLKEAESNLEDGLERKADIEEEEVERPGVTPPTIRPLMSRRDEISVIKRLGSKL